jgi:hypothetical protein
MPPVKSAFVGVGIKSWIPTSAATKPKLPATSHGAMRRQSGLHSTRSGSVAHAELATNQQAMQASEATTRALLMDHTWNHA